MIKIKSRPKLKKPILIAAWPGMGGVAFKAVSYLMQKLPVKEFAEIPSTTYSPPTSISAKNNIIQAPYFPQNKFYYYKDAALKNDIILFLGESQPSSSKQYELAQEIVAFAKKLKVGLIYTLAGMLIYEEKTDGLKVWGVATDSKLIDKLKTYEVKPMKAAYISGLNGLLLGVAKEAGIAGACLLAELPFYALQIEYTPSCLAALDVLSKMFNLKIDMKQMQASSAEAKRQIKKLIDHIRENLLVEEGDEEQGEMEGEEEEDTSKKLEKELGISSEISPQVKYRIEKLFDVSKKDTKKALELKALLDKWELFKHYEDRFLDLFKKENQ
ncbi:MAG: PAC2 family protein [Candidatus Omnitrophica bacterium]|nr:PAC2 family protein [Candidatus Omnitrophota bacterium]MBU1047580.1 PAC2 family protein [Candidatus Omnitrophota bacterium]MBU1631130.1 PAC2 family protein [Candidatus Omnitrophota bacterium]MBU1766989.1 PAC2 family protein [Candidatus Omnitrophota bacterium]MBU1888943.1 PAC2 family protein [Candidatus Omnitrophota bacterium]